MSLHGSILKWRVLRALFRPHSDRQRGQADWMGVGRHSPIDQRKTIIYCGRSLGKVENQGRSILNEPDLVSLLRAYEASRGFRVIEFDHLQVWVEYSLTCWLTLMCISSQYPTLESLFTLFGNARLLVGPHGGCLTNVNYMSCGSTLVEIMPLVGGVRPPLGQ